MGSSTAPLRRVATFAAVHPNTYRLQNRARGIIGSAILAAYSPLPVDQLIRPSCIIKRRQGHRAEGQRLRCESTSLADFRHDSAL